jgi:hypothetical protein
MTLPKNFLETVAAADPSHDPLALPWPIPGNPGGFISFAKFSEWQDFVLRFSLHNAVPQIVTRKFERSQKLHILAWIDFDLIKAGELVALTALELALTDRYGPRAKAKYGNMAFGHLLRYMPEHDGLTDDKVPMIRRCGGTVVDLLNGKRVPSLADIRNSLAHGYPFDGFPWAGLLELVRDLIEYAYRDFAPELNSFAESATQA